MLQDTSQSTSPLPPMPDLRLLLVLITRPPPPPPPHRFRRPLLCRSRPRSPSRPLSSLRPCRHPAPPPPFASPSPRASPAPHASRGRSLKERHRVATLDRHGHRSTVQAVFAR